MGCAWRRPSQTVDGRGVAEMEWNGDIQGPERVVGSKCSYTIHCYHVLAKSMLIYIYISYIYIVIYIYDHICIWGNEIQASQSWHSHLSHLESAIGVGVRGFQHAKGRNVTKLHVSHATVS